ncbi:2-amino-3,7-dideoxy-D-threo-hept-6-ulosonate synthase [Pseudogulbenkiania subflava]|uniref:2-amino-3,7-dideoxy-D-threo-hept-6-ulosonate synthase n=1 Tax=Pseudogulbenkiania subflava DSM 22618 TaxID=1123014 RepID=A0A1Y6BS34_9NEIS|nr:2-amino-3,7-dideoxy-D-threo-hept-6-ulosonate synthase [Pseudogulbenkiania subflava]SMF17071.1 2-amino-3,7-dideoxy-D-threo-hept-6-ulosonate synthase [Pseudogulbenkiania subflava DSM 22618]
MSSGKKVRLSRLRQMASGKSLIVPMDHGATLGPIEGLADLASAVSHLCGASAQVQGVVLHRGAMAWVGEMLPPHLMPPRILHISSSTALSADASAKSQVACVEDALQIGADAVSIHVNLGVDSENQMMRDFGTVVSHCQRWNMPLLAMVYVRRKGQVSNDVSDVKLGARVAAEMGADLVKVSYPGSAAAMREVVDGCFSPVLIAGGEKSDTPQAALQMVRAAMTGGAAGVCIGRNFFQAHDPTGFLRAMAEAVHGTQPAAQWVHRSRREAALA